MDTWTFIDCLHKVRATYFPIVEFINDHQVVWTSITDEERYFHNESLPNPAVTGFDYYDIPI